MRGTQRYVSRENEWLTHVLIPPKHKDFAFRLQTADMERVVLSPKYVDEINRSVPDGTLSIQEAMHEVQSDFSFTHYPRTLAYTYLLSALQRLITQQTKLRKVFASSLHIDVCKVQLTQNLRKFLRTVRVLRDVLTEDLTLRRCLDRPIA
jgi:hypothetical protein